MYRFSNIVSFYCRGITLILAYPRPRLRHGKIVQLRRILQGPSCAYRGIWAIRAEKSP